MPDRASLRLLPVFGVLALLIGVNAPTARAASAAPAEGVAARYPGDTGIAKDAAVIFADDFESWTEGGTRPPEGTWDVHKNPTSRTQVIGGNVSGPGLSLPGSHVLEIACWKREGQGGSSGGLEYLLGNYNSPRDRRGDGYDELYVRYYIKLDDDYHTGCHGSNLGGRDFTRGNTYWVGQAAMLDVGAVNYFFSGLQPYPVRGGKNPDFTELEYGFYSYHLDKPDAWGERFKPLQQAIIRPGEWHCVERHLKLNTVDADAPPPAPASPAPAADDKPRTQAEKQARYQRAIAERDRLNASACRDGIEELWVDGQLTIRQPVRYRRSAKLHITDFTLEQWYGSLTPDYTPEHPVKVFYDNVVVARTYIGPTSTPRRSPADQ